MGRGKDIANSVIFDIVAAWDRGDSKSQIARDLGVNRKTVITWVGRRDEVKSLQLKRKRLGNVGAKPKFDQHGKLRLIRLNKKMTQKKLAKLENSDPKTIRKYVKYHHKLNPGGSKKYKRGKAPKFTPRVQNQRLQYVKTSPVGKASQASKAVWDREKVKWAFIDHMPLAEIGVTSDSQFVWLPPNEKKEKGIEPRSKSKKFPRKLQVLTCFSWHTKNVFVHANRAQRKTLTKNRDYLIRKRNVNVGEFLQAVEWLGPILKRSGVENLIADNDSKLHSKRVVEAWRKYGIEVWPSAGKNSWDRAEGVSR